MLRMSWKTFRSGSGDRVEIPSNCSDLNNGRSRRNALVFLVDFVSTERTHSGRSTVHGAGTEAGPAPSATCLGGVPVQPGSQRDLWIPQRRVRPRDVVGEAISRARWALQLQRLDLPITDEPFAAVILCTAAREKVDKRTRSKWSRVLRYAMEYKTNAEPLAPFIRRKGGINKCAARFARWVGRYGRN
jgi:hypothetical protein